MVIKLDDGEPEDYAVLHASYDGEGPVTSMVFDGDAVYFTSDGLYKIDLPIVVAEWCWDGEDVDLLLRRGKRGRGRGLHASDNVRRPGRRRRRHIGLVCGSLTFEETQPSYAPTPEAGLALEPFDCTVNFHPVQVMKTDDEDYYSVMQLDPSTGEYEEVYDLEHLIDGRRSYQCRGPVAGWGQVLRRRVCAS